MSLPSARQTQTETTLHDLAAALPAGMIDTSGAPVNMRVSGLTLDSRKVETGFLFAALKGDKLDGHAFIPQAVKSGAICVLIGTKDPAPQNIAVLRAENPRRAFSLLVAGFHKSQPKTITAVTGTNGKTSTVQFCRQIWERLNINAACLGTLGVTAPALGMSEDGSITTPDPESLHRTLAELAAKDCNHLAMEASSHGLDQYRLDGVRVTAAGFTNLTHDHLDYHKTLENYLAAKMRLFTDLLPPGGTAVLNMDDPVYEQLAAACADKKIVTYSLKNPEADFAVTRRMPKSDGQDITLNVSGRDYELFFPRVGAFQLYNALCAAALVMAEADCPPAQVILSLEHLAPVRGRMEYVGSPAGINAGIYVDYAHTPDALENVLTALRPHTQSRLYALIGCGGDRDRSKRPIMGETAAKFADHVIVTDDNPRSEEPAAIRVEVMTGCPEAENIGDRKEAIFHAVSLLKDGDVLVVSGKGHEQGQKIGDDIIPFDDAETVRAAIAAS